MNLFKRIFTKFHADLDMEKEKESRIKELDIERAVDYLKNNISKLHLKENQQTYIYRGFEVKDDMVYVDLMTSKGQRIIKFIYTSDILCNLVSEVSRSRERWICFETYLDGFNLKNSK